MVLTCVEDMQAIVNCMYSVADIQYRLHAEYTIICFGLMLSLITISYPSGEIQLQLTPHHCKLMYVTQDCFSPSVLLVECMLYIIIVCCLIKQHHLMIWRSSPWKNNCLAIKKKNASVWCVAELQTCRHVILLIMLWF